MNLSKYFLLLLALTGCAREMGAHGWEDLEEHKKEITVGKMTRDDVHNILGAPSATDITTKKEWYYVQLIEEGFGIAKMHTKVHKMLKVTFNDKGVVQSATIEDIKKPKQEAEPIVREKTKTTGYSEGFIKDTFGRIGQR